MSTASSERKVFGKFEPNVHSIERVIRIVTGLGLISLAFVGPENPWFLIGVVPLMTGLIGWCPPYTLLGVNTCRIGRSTK